MRYNEPQGIILSTLLVPPQISVPHAQMPQITAMVVCLSSVGGSIGNCIAGGIYTNVFRPALWRHLGDAATPALVESLFESITGTLPAWGSTERMAINAAVRSFSGCFLTFFFFFSFPVCGSTILMMMRDISGAVLGSHAVHDLCGAGCLHTRAFYGPLSSQPSLAVSIPSLLQSRVRRRTLRASLLTILCSDRNNMIEQ